MISLILAYSCNLFYPEVVKLITKSSKSLLGLLIILSFSGLFSNAQAQSLSDKIPLSIVDELIGMGIWKNHYDDTTKGEGKNLLDFWEIVNSERTEVVVVNGINSLRGTMEEEGIYSYYPELYRIKMMLLRYSKSQRKSAANAIHEKWLETYEEMALKIIKFSGVTEYQGLVSNYERLKRNGRIQFLDLDPELRTRLSSYGSKSHSVAIFDKDPNTNLYKVNGVYNDALKIFAVDLSKSINETLITFAHELIHAADPEILNYRATARSLYSDVLSILYGWVGSNRFNAEDIARDLLNHVLYETSSTEVIKRLREIRDIKIQVLQQKIEESESTFTPKPEELVVIDNFFKAVVGQTVINEYRAYGLSLALYLTVKEQKNLVPPSRDRRRFIEQFMSGDEIFAVNLSNDFNPFKHYNSNEFSAVMVKAAGSTMDSLAQEANVVITQEMVDSYAPEQIENIKLKKQRAQDTLNFMKALNILELRYLTTLDRELRSLNNRFKRYFHDLKADVGNDILPDWARPGGMSSQLHPFQILTARMTTAWIIRFKRNLSLIYSELHSQSSTLFNMRLGILDLSDVSNGERELLGIKYTDRIDGSPSSLSDELKVGISEIPEAVKDYFELVRWKDNKVKYRSTPIRKSVVMKNLVKLRLLKALLWIEKTFPSWESTIVQSISFLEKLQLGQYDKSQLDAERAQQLADELRMGLELSKGAKDEFDYMYYLLNDLGTLYRMADEDELSNHFALLSKNRNSIVRSLNMVAIHNNLSVENYEKALEEESKKFNRTISRSSYQKYCKRDSRGKNKANITFYSSGSSTFTVRNTQFPLSMVCNQNKLYLVRQPGDIKSSMTSQFEDFEGEQGVTIRVFNGTRPIFLD